MEELKILDYSDIRVLTTKQLADAYETNVINIKSNVSANKDKFVEGTHYYKVAGDELRELKALVNTPDLTVDEYPINKFASVLVLWTEEGANRHCKILNTEKAWQQFNVLEETYFNKKKEEKLVAATANDNAPVANKKKTLADALVEKISLLAEHVKSAQVKYEETTKYVNQLSKKIDETEQLFDYTRAIVLDDKVSLRTLANSVVYEVSVMTNESISKSWALIYDELQRRAHCNLRVRLSNMQKRALDKYSVHNSRRINYLDVIFNDDRLSLYLAEIIRELIVKHNLRFAIDQNDTFLLDEKGGLVSVKGVTLPVSEDLEAMQDKELYGDEEFYQPSFDDSYEE